MGLSGALGYDEIHPGTNMVFEQAQVTMNWQAGDKVTMTVSAGGEDRQLPGSDMINPIFNGTLTYRPWEHTAASLAASRTVTPSAYQNEVQVNTTISATFRQQFLQYLTFEASGGYSTVPYTGGATGQQARTDDSRFVRVSFISSFRQRGTVSIFYSFNDTSSSSSTFALTSRQMGIELGWRY